jgi:hypothetical protein
MAASPSCLILLNETYQVYLVTCSYVGKFCVRTQHAILRPEFPHQSVGHARRPEASFTDHRMATVGKARGILSLLSKSWRWLLMALRNPDTCSQRARNRIGLDRIH